MFDIEIINQDSFLDLPMESKALYFLLGMEADDEGFVAPRKVLRLYGGTEDSLKVLIAKKFIIPFSTGVIVITDWKRNNYLDKSRIKETIYQDEKKQIAYNENTEKYECLTNVKQMLNQYSIEENSIEENRVEDYKGKKKTFPPKLEEIEEYCKSRDNDVNAKAFFDYYEANDWKDKDGKKVRSWKQKVITWENHEKKESKQSYEDRRVKEWREAGERFLNGG